MRIDSMQELSNVPSMKQRTKKDLQAIRLPTFGGQAGQEGWGVLLGGQSMGRKGSWDGLGVCEYM